MQKWVFTIPLLFYAQKEKEKAKRIGVKYIYIILMGGVRNRVVG